VKPKHSKADALLLSLPLLLALDHRGKVTFIYLYVDGHTLYWDDGNGSWGHERRWEAGGRDLGQP
jgi:hypothetical protein